MNTIELNNLIDEIVNEVFEKNPHLTNELILPEHIKLTTKVSCLVNFKILQKLGILDEFTDSN